MGYVTQENAQSASRLFSVLTPITCHYSVLLVCICALLTLPKSWSATVLTLVIFPDQRWFYYYVGHELRAYCYKIGGGFAREEYGERSPNLFPGTKQESCHGRRIIQVNVIVLKQALNKAQMKTRGAIFGQASVFRVLCPVLSLGILSDGWLVPSAKQTVCLCPNSNPNHNVHPEINRQTRNPLSYQGDPALNFYYINWCAIHVVDAPLAGSAVSRWRDVDDYHLQQQQQEHLRASVLEMAVATDCGVIAYHYAITNQWTERPNSTAAYPADDFAGTLQHKQGLFSTG